MPPSSSSCAAAAAMARPSSRPSSSGSVSKPRKPSPTPSPSPSPATAPKPNNKAAGSSSRLRRSPLSDLNSRDASAARERPGCFGFLLPSSAASGSRSRSRSASTPRTPKRPDPKPRARARRPDRLPDQESRTRAERCAGQEPRRRGQEEPIGAQAQTRKVEPAPGKKQWPSKKGQRLEQLDALTPEKKADSGATPSTGATPPVHASISPEVAAACGSATPACFAAGHHVVPGVGDRRKCRPRGILAIAGEQGMASEDPDAEPSRASIRWLSSPSAGACSTKCGAEEEEEEASVNWLVSPRDEAGAGGLLIGDEIFVPRCSSEDAFWRFSPDGAGLLGGLLDFGTPASEVSGATPSSSSGFLPVQKTPSSGDSISPFSLIVKRASQSSARLRTMCAQQGLGSSHRYGSAADPTPVSGESWPESVSNGTRSGLARTGSRPMRMMDPVVECLEMMALSPRPGDDGNGALPAPLPELSFQFTGALMPLESVDLTSFKRSPRDIELKAKETSFRKPAMVETRISWREGLVSRMFDIGDLDCCKWLSDDEDAPLLSLTDEAVRDDDTNSSPGNGSCLREGGSQHEAGGFGSVEFSCVADEPKNDSSKPSPNPVSVAESMRAEGFELVSSDDSDWTLFYKNDLFES
ncbi:hypothetical protein BS78_05G114100 [Paspalum vaginatum]|nr:hypothetical protein BS78_05G114100 [Paspalum vaginatum]